MKKDKKTLYESDNQVSRYARDMANLYSVSRKQRLKIKAQKEQLQRYAKDFASTIQQLNSSHDDLHNAYLDTILRLIITAGYKDSYTGDHLIRISELSLFMAEKAGYSDHECYNLYYAAPLHDIGKIAIPDGILQKKGALTHEEFEIMKSHTIVGSEILAQSSSIILQTAATIALYHHERWDGEGYPNGLKATQIPHSCRIVSLVDTYDALTSDRPYRQKMHYRDALKIIHQEREKQFDPDLVDLLFKNVDSIEGLKKSAFPNPDDTPRTSSILPVFPKDEP